MLENKTSHEATSFVASTVDGAEEFVVVVRATFTWDRQGTLSPCEAPTAIRTEDLWGGRPGLSGLVAESDLVPPKPKVDFLLEGKLQLASAAKRAEVALRLGTRRKKAVVFGDRYWLPGIFRAVALSEPREFKEMPFAWERSFGGFDPEFPECVERRNPCGRGLRNKARSLEKQPAPNFEDPGQPISSWNDRPAPVGFGPMARHWEPRVRLAGTYDSKWRKGRFPLLPQNFDSNFYNCAPADQQLAAYEPGMQIGLEGMTPAAAESFRLPSLEVPVTFVRRRGPPRTITARPDTVVIEPASRRLSVVARATCLAQPDVYAFRRLIVDPAREIAAMPLAPAKRAAP